MKTTWISIVCVAMFAAACSVEVNNEDTASIIQCEVTIHATSVDGSSTKTTRKEDGSVWWVPGDAISVFYSSGTAGGSRFVSRATDTTKITDFTGMIDVVTGGLEFSPEQAVFWGLYPYSEDASCDGSGVSMTLPSTQRAQAGSFANGMFPSIGRSNGLYMGFYNICSGLKFSVTKPGIKKVIFCGNGGEDLAGRAKVTFDEDNLPSAEILDGCRSIVLEAPEGETLEVGAPYFIVFFPCTFSAGFTITLETDSEYATVSINGAVTAKRSVFGRIENIDAEAVYHRNNDIVNVEDPTFKSYLVEKFDEDGDGEISYSEARQITDIEIGNYSRRIESLGGIEFMPELQILCASFTNLTHLDLSANKKLTFLQLDNNRELTSLDISGNALLDSLYCYANSLTALDVTRNPALKYLECTHNQLTSLDLSNNSELEELRCHVNQIAELDLSNNAKLFSLECSYNQLTSLDLSSNPALTNLSCGNNKLTSLDISNLDSLVSLACGVNQLTELDASDKPVLKELFCYGNKLTTLDISNNPSLKILNCQSNKLSTLEVPASTALTHLFCERNGMQQLIIPNCSELIELFSQSNSLTSLDLSNCVKIKDLHCYSNLLTGLDVSKCAALETLQCYSNLLTSLDVSKNTELYDLDCAPMNDTSGNNLLSSLYIYPDQYIWQVTENRSDNIIPAETAIIVLTE